VSKNKILQYIALYAMLIFNQSNLYRYFLMPYRIIILIISALFLVMIVRKTRIPNLTFLVFLLLFVILVRLLNGGIGLETYADYAIPIIVTTLAVCINEKKFLERYIHIAVFISAFSLLGVGLSVIAPTVLRSLPTSFTTGWGVSTWTLDTAYTTNFYHGYGTLLFSWIDRGGVGARNVGIFTEPGIFQMVINTSVFCLLFMKDYYEIDEKRVQRYLIILILTMLTCQSTSGMMGMTVMLIIYLVLNQDVSKKTKRWVLSAVFLAIVVIAVDSIVRKDNSILQSAIINKLISDDGAISLGATSSGMARIGTITVCFYLMITHPLGMGTVNTVQMVLQANSSNVAGALMAFGATMGVIPFVGTLYWVFKPVFTWRKSLVVKLLFVFLYLNTALAQSSAFYPALIMVPILLRIDRTPKYTVKTREV
jgi:hypothetical protein